MKWGRNGGDGTIGAGDGEFNTPYMISIDYQNRLYVTDRFNYRIQVFNTDGSFVAKWGSAGNAIGNFNMPSGVAIDSEDHIYVADYTNQNIQKFDANGNPLWEYTNSGEFTSAAHIAINYNHFYVITPSMNKVVVYGLPMGLQAVKIDIVKGALTSTSPYLEYSVDSTNGMDGTWTVGSWGTTSAAFAVNTKIYVREAAAPTNVRLVKTIAPPAAPSVTADLSNGQTAVKLVGATVAMEYSRDGGATWTNVTPGIAAGTDTVDVSTQPNNDLRVRLKMTSSELASLSTAQLNIPPSSNANLSGLSVSGGVLTPEFAAETVQYTVQVGYDQSNVSITANVDDAKATVSINGISSSSHQVNLSDGTNSIPVVVTAEDLSTTKTYTLKVIRGVALSGLGISAGTLSPAFASGTTTYTAEVGYDVTNLTVTANVYGSNTTVTINGLAGAIQNVSLQDGTNTIPIVLTSQDGTVTQSYTLKVVRGVSLSGLGLSAGTLSPAFASGTTTYTAEVGYDVTNLTVTANVYGSNTTVTINGLAGAIQNVSLQDGTNTIPIVLTSQDGTVTQAYTLKVVRGASLSGLGISAGTLSPAFASGTTTYTAEVGYDVTNLTVTTNVYGSNTTVTINGLAGAIQNVSLQDGTNTIPIVLTSQDGTVTQSYTLKVVRGVSLSGLGLSAGTLSPALASGTTTYSAEVGYDVTGLTVTANVYGSNTTITINGLAGAIQNVSLQDGTNTIPIVLTSQDGTVTQAYTLNVTRAVSTDASLSSLQLSSGVLSPAFSSSTTAYTSSVAHSITSVTVTATVHDPLATLKVNGTTVVSGEVSSPINLTVGQNTIVIVVTAQNGVMSTYQVTVTRVTEGGSSPSNSTSSSSSTTVPIESKPNFQVRINDKQQEQLATGSITTEGGKTVVTITFDAAKLAAQLGTAGESPVIDVPVTSSADQVRLTLTGDIVKAMEGKQALLNIRTENGSYKLPPKEIFIDRLAQQFGESVSLEDITIQVSIAKGDSSTIAQLEALALLDGYTLVVPPVEFTVTATYNGRTIAVHLFTSYVEKEIPLPDDVDQSRVTTAVVLNNDGTVRSVPTYITQRDGTYYAIVNSLTNSTYVLIWHERLFSDMEGHWAKAAVNDLASRLVLNGVAPMHFVPDQAITRAEFSTILVRALGISLELTDNGKGTNFFDVKSGDWYAGAVSKAQEYGFIQGYEDGTFRPDRTITREEAMVMISRVMNIVGLGDELSRTEAEAVLAKFIDSETLSDWAKQAVGILVESRLVNGTDTGLKPTSPITRAETAVIVQRLLQEAMLIGKK
ncbi:cadherin-like beta sandwich domain-containing protein [Paenibacillus sp. 1_12]|uniref:cadherin-like beta sandwich domain-containing protein n=1 Tax=Paenibacillus sp. 1_12 TaxID=1566278 RepID=UPI001C43B70B|nr:cadherin-like beta sandwich domain-containing protein [Paenibacillus sp. 1_12]